MCWNKRSKVDIKMTFIDMMPSANPVDESRTTVHLSTGQTLFPKLSPFDLSHQVGLHTWFASKQVVDKKGENGLLHNPSVALLLATTLN
jgi:hypothetical protein